MRNTSKLNRFVTIIEVNISTSRCVAGRSRKSNQSVACHDFHKNPDLRGWFEVGECQLIAVRSSIDIDCA